MLWKHLVDRSGTLPRPQTHPQPISVASHAWWLAFDLRSAPWPFHAGRAPLDSRRGLPRTASFPRRAPWWRWSQNVRVFPRNIPVKSPRPSSRTLSDTRRGGWRETRRRRVCSGAGRCAHTSLHHYHRVHRTPAKGTFVYAVSTRRLLFTPSPVRSFVRSSVLTPKKARGDVEVEQLCVGSSSSTARIMSSMRARPPTCSAMP
eukprot:scaffold585_cov330-Pavlova_lutheri.AAC.26